MVTCTLITLSHIKSLLPKINRSFKPVVKIDKRDFSLATRLLYKDPLVLIPVAGVLKKLQPRSSIKRSETKNYFCILVVRLRDQASALGKESSFGFQWPV